MNLPATEWALKDITDAIKKYGQESGMLSKEQVIDWCKCVKEALIANEPNLPAMKHRSFHRPSCGSFSPDVCDACGA